MNSDDDQNEILEKGHFPAKCLRKSKRKQTFTSKEVEGTQRHNKRIIRNHGDLICPVCELTLRQGDIETHYHQEYEKLVKLLPLKSRKTSTSSRGKNAVDSNLQPVLEHGTENSNGERCSLNVADQARSDDMSSTNLVGDVSGPSTSQVSWNKNIKAFQENQEFKRVKVNRLLRRQCIKWKAISIQSDETICPVCQEPVPVESEEELKVHANRCLIKEQENISDDDDNEIDVIGDEYEWCGIKRVRITSLLKSQGQLEALGTMVTKGNEDEDVDVCVLQSEEEEFGPSQYSQDDLDVTSNSPEKVCNGLEMSGTESGAETLLLITEDSIEPTENLNRTNKDETQNNSFSGSQNAIIKALQMKIRELEERGNFICHICHGPYIMPLTSTVCWHVHCEKCWLQALSTQKLCPQCKCIVSPTDLRKIFL